MGWWSIGCHFDRFEIGGSGLGRPGVEPMVDFHQGDRANNRQTIHRKRQHPGHELGLTDRQGHGPDM